MGVIHTMRLGAVEVAPVEIVGDMAGSAERIDSEDGDNGML
jgi:hypothetical protein